MEDPHLALRFAVALGLGVLIGLERERAKGEEGGAGVRTFALIALTGAIAGYLDRNLGLGGLAFAVFLALASFALAFSNPVNVILAQELIPNNISTASALMIGSSWGTGGLFAATFGLFADAYGVPALLKGIAFIPLGAALLGLILFRRRVAQTVDSQTFKQA